MDLAQIVFFPGPLVEGIQTGLQTELCTATDGSKAIVSESAAMSTTLQWAQERGYCKSGSIKLYCATGIVHAYDPKGPPHIILRPPQTTVQKTNSDALADVQARIQAMSSMKTPN